MRAIGTETSCLMLPPSGNCAVLRGCFEPARQCLRLRQRAGDHRVVDDVLLGCGGEQPLHRRLGEPAYSCALDNWMETVQGAGSRNGMRVFEMGHATSSSVNRLMNWEGGEPGRARVLRPIGRVRQR